MQNILSVYKGKKVLVTGNTGFKGSWMTMMLLNFEAQITGYALEPPTNPSVYKKLTLNNKVTQYINDIRSYSDLKDCISKTKPDIIFHLAAQPLVRLSYENPKETFDVNITGTVNLLEAVRELNFSTKIICVTSDKCYENQEWMYGYREADPMGGYDPYSASKGADELIISSYRNSFFHPKTINKHGVKLASVRAGNVIGGGDWAKDRIVPDCIRSLEKNEEIYVRNPYATRPWQHVLEPVTGYLLLGAKMFDEKVSDEYLCSAFNFGPLISSNKSVQKLVDEIILNWGNGKWTHDALESVHEASLLNLTIDKAFHVLKWHPVWDFKETVSNTVQWYKRNYSGDDLEQFTLEQIKHYLDSFQLVTK